MRDPVTDAERRALELLTAGAGLEEIRAALGVETALEAYERMCELVPETGRAAAALYLIFADLTKGGLEGMRVVAPGEAG